MTMTTTTKTKIDNKKQRRRGRAKDPLVSAGQKLDRLLNQLLRTGGEPVTDKDGNVQLDGDGKVIRRPISAAHMETIRKRLKDAGLERDRRRGRSIQEELIDEAHRRGFSTDKRPVDPFPGTPFPGSRPADPFPATTG